MSDWSTLIDRWFLLHETCTNNLYCVHGFQRGACWIHMPVWLNIDESQRALASSYLPRFPRHESDTQSLLLRGCCSAHHSSWILSSTCLGIKLFLVSQIPSLSLCLYHSQSLQRSLCCRVFPAPGLPICGSWWSSVECGEEGAGRHASLKKGVLNCSHTHHPPPTDLSLTWPFGGGRAKDAERWN